MLKLIFRFIGVLILDNAQVRASWLGVSLCAPFPSLPLRAPPPTSLIFQIQGLEF